MPLEWLDAGSWRLPSGKALAEFALQSGFLAPLLFKAQRFGGAGHGAEDRSSMAAMTIRTKQFGKAGER
ncbi:MAG: hypothetical protein M3N54_12405 [Acidobacteriota bacterium]|nr:hypothetical protein [Acidobacteriota bacterium]